MLPLALLAEGALKYGPAAIGAARSLFGGGGSNYGGYNPGRFSFTPNENDPTLLLMRRRALEEITRGRSDTVNEIGRAGLLGSSAGFNLLSDQRNQGLRSLDDVNNQAFGNQRAEALQLFRDQENFKREIALGNAGYGHQENLLGLGGLGDIGNYLSMMHPNDKIKALLDELQANPDTSSYSFSPRG